MGSSWLYSIYTSNPKPDYYKMPQAFGYIQNVVLGCSLDNIKDLNIYINYIYFICINIWTYMETYFTKYNVRFGV